MRRTVPADQRDVRPDLLEVVELLGVDRAERAAAESCVRRKVAASVAACPPSFQPRNAHTSTGSRSRGRVVHSTTIRRCSYRRLQPRPGPTRLGALRAAPMGADGNRAASRRARRPGALCAPSYDDAAAPLAEAGLQARAAATRSAGRSPSPYPVRAAGPRAGLGAGTAAATGRRAARPKIAVEPQPGHAAARARRPRRADGQPRPERDRAGQRGRGLTSNFFERLDVEARAARHVDSAAPCCGRAGGSAC